ncbi:MAG: SDR family oxidoreductase [Ramlibacter sp.]|nr:SDR family oxidoreductase [Ramlibacter sp.]
MKSILIIGANSAIAAAAARLWAAQGHRMHLMGRSGDRLATLAADLKIRGASSVGHTLMDANDFALHAALLERAMTELGVIDIVLVAHGTLGDQAACERDFGLALDQFNTNALSVISLLTHLGAQFERQGHGTIAVIGSVAGDRGRRSNYVYGAAKAAVATFTQGLRNRMNASNVQVLTIKPGFVDTPMTSGFPKGALWCSPERAARGILAAINRRADVAYVPGFWRWIMLIVRSIPEAIFKRMSL